MKPFIIGIGGTTSNASSTENALQIALRAAEARGARTRMFGCDMLSVLPHYASGACDRSEAARELVSEVRAADGLIIASPHQDGSSLLENMASSPPSVSSSRLYGQKGTGLYDVRIHWTS